MFYHTYGESAEATRELSRDFDQDFASVYESVLGWTWSRAGHPCVGMSWRGLLHQSSEATRELLKGVHPDFGTPPFPRGEKG
jgi:hypothetical protein